MRICVFDADTEGDSAYLDLSQQDYLGEAEVEVPTLVHNSSSVSLPLFKEGKPAGTAIVKCEEMNQSSGDIIFNLRGEEIPSDCFLRISNILSEPSGTLNSHVTARRMESFLSSRPRFRSQGSGRSFLSMFLFCVIAIMYSLLLASL